MLRRKSIAYQPRNVPRTTAVDQLPKSFIKSAISTLANSSLKLPLQ